MSKSTSQSGGVSFLGLLTIVFITLKLCHVIDWSWWWVLAPLWGGVALFLGVAVITGILLLAGAIVTILLGEKWGRK